MSPLQQGVVVAHFGRIQTQFYIFINKASSLSGQAHFYASALFVEYTVYDYFTAAVITSLFYLGAVGVHKFHIVVWDDVVADPLYVT